MSRTRFAVFGLLAVFASAAALACGPEFPWQLLDDRAKTLETLPDNSFAFEAAHLIEAPADAPHASGWHVASDSNFYRYEHYATTDAEYYRQAVEAETLTEPQRQLVEKIRTAPNDDAAKAAGKGLPDDVLLYTLGAGDFLSKNYTLAASHFQAAMIADPAKQTLYSVWAAFMLGRTQTTMGDRGAALKTYAALRKSVVAGAPDPLDVAIASYGQEARFLIQDADDAKRTKANGWQAMRADDLTKAVHLYALQSALGSHQGDASLMIMANELLFDPNDLKAAIGDSTVRRLVIDYTLSREGFEKQLSFDDTRKMGAFDHDLLADRKGKSDAVATLLTAIGGLPISEIDGADRLAAICYRSGHYDLARGFAAKSASSLSNWVQAKLALRNGKRDEVAKFYAQAINGMTAQPHALDPAFSRRLRGERAILSLSHQDYLVALEQLYPDANIYWGDVAYLAERVLTTDELKGFVDAHVPVVPNETLKKIEYVETPETVVFPNPPLLLRELLARRLMREGRVQEAVDYFGEKNRPNAVIYAGFTTTAKASHGIARAKALHGAAGLERHHGLELLGYEAFPDMAVYEGDFETGLGQPAVFGNHPANVKKLDFRKFFTSADEAKRFTNSRAEPDQRFHYRYIAAQHEVEAANLVPKRSEAYAALLCHAVARIRFTEPALAQDYYMLYTHHGAYVSWADNFWCKLS